MSKYRSITCACGATLDRRNVRSSGMAVCRCGNNFTAAQFEVVADKSRHPRGEYARSSWDADLADWVLDPRGTLQRIY